MTDTHNDPFVFKLMTLFKSDGYLVYEITLEILGSNDAIDKPLKIEKELLSRNMRLPWERIAEIFNTWKIEKPEFIFNDLGIEVEIYTPKIREIMDEWARRKAHRSNSGVTRELLGDKVKEKVNVKEKVKVKPTTLSEGEQGVVSAWNELVQTPAGQRAKISKVLAVSKARREHITARLKEQFFKDNYKKALATIPGRAFCMGQNDRGWVATFEWFIRPNTVIDLIEGTKYQGNKMPTKQDKAFDIERDNALRQAGIK